jgi:hypothetical protein
MSRSLPYKSRDITANYPSEAGVFPSSMVESGKSIGSESPEERKRGHKKSTIKGGALPGIEKTML